MKTYIKLNLLILISLFASQITLANANVKYKDTAIFNQEVVKQTGLLNFTDNNIIKIASKGIKISAHSNGQTFYSLIITKQKKDLITISHIKGVTKVFCDNKYLMFSVLTYLDEDGNNEGYGYVMDLQKNIIKKFPRKLINTSNPIAINNNFYFLNGLSLIKANVDFNHINKIKINYNAIGKSKEIDYLDTYFINSLSINNSDNLIIDFSPVKDIRKSRQFAGRIDSLTTFIVLRKK